MYKILIALILSLCGFFMASYFFNFILFESRTVELKLHLTESTEGQLLYVFDKVSAANNWNEETINVDGNTNTLSLEIPFDVRVKTLFLMAKDSVKIGMNRMEMSGIPTEYSFGITEMESFLAESYFYEKPSAALNTNANGLGITMNGTRTCLEVKESFFDGFYSEISSRVRWYSAAVSFALFVFSLLYLLNKTRIQSNYKTTFFFTFILLLIIGFLSPKQNSTKENRTLIPFPGFKVNIWKIPGKYTAYFNDHFPFRSEISSASSNFKSKVLGTSPNPDVVRIGKEGWLFSSEPNIRKVSRGSVLYTAQELKETQENLERIESEIQKLGSSFYVFIPPLKHSIYPEMLPISMSRGDYNKRIQLMDYLKENSNLNIIDVYPKLKEKKDSVEIYYQTDTHWNQLGGFFAYQEMIRKIAEKYPIIGEAKRLEDYTVTQNYEYSGDLLQMINIYDQFKRNVFLMKPNYVKQSSNRVIEIPKYHEAKYSSYTSVRLKEKPRLLMYRDSYNEYIFKHLSEHFSYYGMAWTREMSLSRIEEVKPDIVVYEMMERYVDRLMDEDLLVK